MCRMTPNGSTRGIKRSMGSSYDYFQRVAAVNGLNRLQALLIDA